MITPADGQRGVRHVDDGEHVVEDGLVVAGGERAAVQHEVDLGRPLLERLGGLERLDAEQLAAVRVADHGAERDAGSAELRASPTFTSHGFTVRAARSCSTASATAASRSASDAFGCVSRCSSRTARRTLAVMGARSLRSVDSSGLDGSLPGRPIVAASLPVSATVAPGGALPSPASDPRRARRSSASRSLSDGSSSTRLHEPIQDEADARAGLQPQLALEVVPVDRQPAAEEEVGLTIQLARRSAARAPPGSPPPARRRRRRRCRRGAARRGAAVPIGSRRRMKRRTAASVQSRS